MPNISGTKNFSAEFTANSNATVAIIASDKPRALTDTRSGVISISSADLEASLVATSSSETAMFETEAWAIAAGMLLSTPASEAVMGLDMGTDDGANSGTDVDDDEEDDAAEDDAAEAASAATAAAAAIVETGTDAIALSLTADAALY